MKLKPEIKSREDFYDFDEFDEMDEFAQNDEIPDPTDEEIELIARDEEEPVNSRFRKVYSEADAYDDEEIDYSSDDDFEGLIAGEDDWAWRP